MNDLPITNPNAVRDLVERAMHLSTASAGELVAEIEARLLGEGEETEAMKRALFEADMIRTRAAPGRGKGRKATGRRPPARGTIADRTLHFLRSQERAVESADVASALSIDVQSASLALSRLRLIGLVVSSPIPNTAPARFLWRTKTLERSA